MFLVKDLKEGEDNRNLALPGCWPLTTHNYTMKFLERQKSKTSIRRAKNCQMSASMADGNNME